MSQWHRDHPELTGGPSDPWMRIESYRKLIGPSEEDIQLDRDERLNALERPLDEEGER